MLSEVDGMEPIPPTAGKSVIFFNYSCFILPDSGGHFNAYIMPSGRKLGSVLFAQ
jgi:hypothetical protein